MAFSARRSTPMPPRALPRRATVRQAEIEIGDVVLVDFLWSGNPADNEKNRPALVLNVSAEKGLLVLAPITSSPAGRKGPKDCWRALNPGEARSLGLDDGRDATVVFSETNVVAIDPENPALRLKKGSWTVGRAAPRLVEEIKTARRALNEAGRLAKPRSVPSVARAELDRFRSAGGKPLPDPSALKPAPKSSRETGKPERPTIRAVPKTRRDDDPQR